MVTFRIAPETLLASIHCGASANPQARLPNHSGAGELAELGFQLANLAAVSDDLVDPGLAFLAQLKNRAKSNSSREGRSEGKGVVGTTSMSKY